MLSSDLLLVAHPIALRYPTLSSEDFEALARDIKEKGLQRPIVLFEGKILDGRHRYQACVDEGVDPDFEEYTGDDPEGFAASENFYRRHLSTADKRRIAKELLEKAPERSDRSIAKDSGISRTTVASVRQEIEEETGAPAMPAPRVEASGRKARGRKPGSKNPRMQPDERAQWVVATTKRFTQDARGTVEDFLMMIKDCHKVTLISLTSREDFVGRFASALDVKMTDAGPLSD